MIKQISQISAILWLFGQESAYINDVYVVDNQFGKGAFATTQTSEENVLFQIDTGASVNCMSATTDEKVIGNHLRTQF